MNLNSKDPSLVRFCRHMVTILAETSVPDYPKDSGSGFVVECAGKWWLVTAGHVIGGENGLREIHSRGYLRMLYALDAWAGKDGTGRPVIIPRDYLDRWHVIGTDENPPDIAVLELGDNLTENLREGRIQAAPESDWTAPAGKFDFYLLLGTPAEMIVGSGAGHPPRGYDVVRGLIEVQKVERPERARKTSMDRFYGRLVLDGTGRRVGSIVGASGGPVFGCTRKDDGSFDHRVVGVQSGWLKEEKIITADYLLQLAEFLRSRQVV